jgi:hypothetical protein
MKQIDEIKRLLRLSEIAQSKVEFNFNGTKVINPMQQAAANRIYSKASKLKGDMSCQNFIKIHREVISELQNEKVN